MNRLMTGMTAAALGLAFAAPAAVAQDDTLPTIAVLAFAVNALGANASDYASLSGGVAALMQDVLLRNPGLRVVERGRINELLSEQDLGASGRVDANTAARIGRVLGVRHVIMGDVTTDMNPRTREPNTITVYVYAVEVETTRIISLGDRMRGSPDDLMSLILQTTERAASNLRLPSIPAGPAREAANTAAEKSKKTPFQTILLYSRALEAEDKGKPAEAIQLFRQALDRFPDHEPSQQALSRLQSGG